MKFVIQLFGKTRPQSHDRARNGVRMCIFRKQVRRFRKTFGLRVLCEDIAPRWMEHSWNRAMIQRTVSTILCALNPLTNMPSKIACMTKQMGVSQKLRPPNIHPGNTTAIWICNTHTYFVKSVQTLKILLLHKLKLIFPVFSKEQDKYVYSFQKT